MKYTREEQQRMCDELIAEIENKYSEFEQKTGIVFQNHSTFEYKNITNLVPILGTIRRKSKYDFYYLPQIMDEEAGSLIGVYDPIGPE